MKIIIPFPENPEDINKDYIEKYSSYFGRKVPLKAVSVNEIYATKMKRVKGGGWRSGGKKQTEVAILYKRYVKEFLENELEQYTSLPIKDTKIFYTLVIHYKTPVTEKGEMDKRYLRDADDFLKPFQDSLEGLLVQNDQQLCSLNLDLHHEWNLPYTYFELEFFQYHPKFSTLVNKLAEKKLKPLLGKNE